LPRLQSATFESHRFNPVGPGVLVENLVEFTGPAVRSAIAGDSGAGVMLGAMTTAPSVSVSREVTDRTEDIVGLNAAGVGAQTLQRTDVVLEAELVDLTPEQLMRVHPGLQKSDWMSSAHARLTIGTGNSAFSVWSLAPGTAGNAKTVVVSTPAGATTTVAISGTAGAEVLTIGPKTGETANGVVAAVNASSTANVLFQAGLPATSDGTGTVAAAASTPLASGTAGSRIGYKLEPTGFFKRSDYKRNLCLCLEGDNQDLLHIWRIDNAFQTDDIDFSPDDEGGVSGVSVSFSGHVTEANYDPVLGVYLPPYAVYIADLASSA
jgi:hypothetical protein